MSNIRRRKRSSEELPLGDAIERLFRVLNTISRAGPHEDHTRLTTEKSQLVQALNAISVEMGFECRIDLSGPNPNLVEEAELSEVPTALELIKQGAESSCCRITKAKVANRAEPVNKSRSRSGSTNKSRG
jgi:hypothetical protein